MKLKRFVAVWVPTATLTLTGLRTLVAVQWNWGIVAACVGASILVSFAITQTWDWLEGRGSGHDALTANLIMHRLQNDPETANGAFRPRPGEEQLFKRLHSEGRLQKLPDGRYALPTSRGKSTY